MIKENLAKFILKVAVMISIIATCLSAPRAETQKFLTEAQQHYIDGMFHFTQAVTSEEKSEYDMAITEFKKSIKKNPNFADAYFQLDIIY